jgi:hypothetical protein
MYRPTPATALAILMAATLTLAGCSAAEQTDGSVQQQSAATLDPAELAGTWAFEVMPPDKDTVILTYDLTATADTAGWVVVFPDRPSLALQVTFSGDSVLTSAGPYESAIQKGVMVTTTGTIRIVDGKMVGTTRATYKVASGDSLVLLRASGTKKS